MVLRTFILVHLINAGLPTFISVACFQKRGGGVTTVCGESIVRNVLTYTLVGPRVFIESSCLFNFSKSCEGDSDMLFPFNFVQGWFVASVQGGPLEPFFFC